MIRDLREVISELGRDAVSAVAILLSDALLGDRRPS